jgi:hypothetical protein
MTPDAIWSRLLAPAIAAVWLLLSGSAAASAAAMPCPQDFGSFSAGNWPSACWRPYGPTSPFNEELPANPRLAPYSSGVVADLVHYGNTFNRAGRFQFDSSGRDGVYYARPSDPLVKIHCTYNWGPSTCQGSNGVVVDGMKIHLPAGALPQNGADRHMTVIDQANGVEYDFDQASVSGDTLTVWAGGQIPIGADSGTGLGVPGTAAGFSVLAGLIRAPELAANSINHALVVSIPCTEGYVWPAQRANGLGCGGIGQSPAAGTSAPPLGTLFQLKLSDAQIAGFRAPAWERAIMTAMAHYGLYVNDTNGGGDNAFEIEKESDQTYTTLGGQPQMSDLLRQLHGRYQGTQSGWTISGRPIPISDLRVIDPCVPHGTCRGSGQFASTARARLLRSCRALERARRKHHRRRLPARCTRVLSARKRV